MKTLDEVIKACESTVADIDRGVSIDGCYLDGEDTRDALHYLKEYREKRDEILKTEEALGYCEIADNRPLTWEELRTMEGKPVWLEGEHGCIWNCKTWVLIRLDRENDDLIICVGKDCEFAIGKEDYGNDWQAYRKERS